MSTTDLHLVRTGGDVIRGLLALGVVVLLLGGVPLALLQVAPSPLPQAIPTPDMIIAALAAPDDGTLFVWGLSLAAWLGWATFALALLVEVSAQLRGGSVPRLPALAVQQRAASRLVAAVSLLVAAPALVAVPPPLALLTGTAVPAASAAPSTSASTGEISHPQLWPPAGTAAPTEVVSGQPAVVTVVRGDTLSGIAQEHLGVASRYSEIAEATRDVVQPDGQHLTDPDRIYPGWQVRLPPDAAAPPTSPDGTPAPQAPVSPPPHRDELDVPMTPRSPTPVASPSTSPAPGEAPTTGLTGAWSDEEGWGVASVGLGAVAAAGLVALLARKRTRQQRHRRSGQRPPTPSPKTVSIQHHLRASQDPFTVDQVDRVLRTLAVRCRERGTPIPRVQAARMLPAHLELHLAEPAVPLPPFSATPEADTLWVLDAEADVLDQRATDDVVPPYPALVSLGRDLDGAHVLVDLEEAGVLSLLGSGDPPPGEAPRGLPDPRSVLGALLVELATSAWGENLRVTVLGGSPELVTALDVDRIEQTADVDAALDALQTWAADLRIAMTAADVDSPAAARVNRSVPDAWAVRVLLVDTHLDTDQVAQVDDLLAAQPRLPLAVVTAEGAWPSAWALTLLAGTDLATLQPFGVTLHAQSLPTDVADLVVEALHSADADPADPRPQVEASDTVVEPRHAPAPHATSVMADDAPQVRVLGPVEIVGARGELSGESHRSRITEVVAFLALHPHREHHLLDEALWPGERVPDGRRHQLVSRARRWLGVDEHGRPFVPVVGPLGYRLAESVGTDWRRFTELAAGPTERASTENLLAALALVRGQPFAGTNPRRYGWADVDRQEMIAAIADVAHELGGRARAVGDAVLARRAATTGLAVEPGSEALWRDALLAEQLAGHRKNIELLADRLLALADELGGDLEPETLTLLDELLGRPAGAAR